MRVFRKIEGRVADIALLITLGSICLPMGFFVWSLYSERAAATSCVKGAGEMRVVEGVIRQAGDKLYVQSQRWQWLDIACPAKGHVQCLQNNPGIEALENHVGQAVRAEFCGDHPIAYTVTGRRFTRIGLNEEALRGKP